MFKLIPRLKQADCRTEPNYPSHNTVVVLFSSPDCVCHFKTIRCGIEYPHTITKCNEFNNPQGGKL